MPTAEVVSATDCRIVRDVEGGEHFSNVVNAETDADLADETNVSHVEKQNSSVHGQVKATLKP